MDHPDLTVSNFMENSFGLKKVTLFQLFNTNVVCSLFCLCTLVAYIANNMDPDHTAPWEAVWSGFIVFDSMKTLVWHAFEYIQKT